MYHPLIGDVGKLTDGELQDKITELTKKLNQSHRFGNPALIRQVGMVLDEMTQERIRRDKESLKKIAEQSDGNDKFKDSIDIS
jgi:predicted transcriptional regulator of viral defense system